MHHLRAEWPDLVHGRRPVVVLAVGVPELPRRDEPLEARRGQHLLLRILRPLLRPTHWWWPRGWLVWDHRDRRNLWRRLLSSLELLSLLVGEDDLWVDDGHALGREAVELLLEADGLVGCAFGGHLELLGLGAAGQREELIQVEGREDGGDRLRGAQARPVAGEHAELRRHGLPPVVLRVVAGTVRLLALRLAAPAHVDLVVQRVVLGFFPAVSAAAAVFVLAAVEGVVLDEGFHVPGGAVLALVVVEVRLAPVVLPVVRVHAHVSRVVHVAEGTPHGLEVEHVEVIVLLLHQMEQVDSELGLRVSERAHVSVLAALGAVGVRRAELDLVLLGVVELFSAGVRA